MSAKSIIIKIVLGILAVAVLAGCIYHLLKPSENELGESIDVYLADAEKVKRVEIKGEEEYALVRQGDEWVMEGIEGIKVDEVFADTLVKSLCNIQSPMRVDTGGKLSDFGFDAPLYSVRLDFGDKDKEIFVGNQSGEYYYLKDEGRDVYLVSRADLYMLFLEKIKYLDDSVLSFSPGEVTAFAYKDVKIEKNGDNWVETAPYAAMADNDKVKAILDEISDISALEIVSRGDVDAEAAVKVSLLIDNATALSFDVYGSYIVFEHSEYAYKVSENERAFLSVSGFDLLSKYVAPIAISEVSEVKFTSNEGIINLTVEAPESEAPVFYKNGVEVAEEAFRGFYQSLMGLMFTREGAIEGIVEYEIAFTKTDGSIYCVRFLPLSESEYAIDINGVKGFVINKKSVTDIFEEVKSLK